METIGERLKFFIAKKNLNQSDLSKKVGISKQAVNNFINNLSVPRYDTLHTIKNYFPELNMNWLIAGLGEIEETEYMTLLKDVSQLREKNKNLQSLVHSYIKENAI